LNGKIAANSNTYIEMEKNINRIVVLLLLMLGLQSCGQNGGKGKIETYDQFRTQKLEPRDSIFILYTVKEWSKLNWWTFEDYSKMYKMTNSQVSYFIAGVFYSPDRKKILVWDGEKVPNAPSIEVYNKTDKEVNRICPNGGDTVYNLSALIGFRNNVNDTWHLYPFDQEAAVCGNSKDVVINVLGQYYFGLMKTHQMNRMMQSGERKGYLELEAYGYNLQDKDFWDKCWLWQKDTVGSYNMYPFQLKGYNDGGDKCNKNSGDPYNPPKLNYPEDILKLYK
jgi:hypothetical protein